jgi:pathogenesis-related protein 1
MNLKRFGFKKDEKRMMFNRVVFLTFSTLMLWSVSCSNPPSGFSGAPDRRAEMVATDNVMAGGSDLAPVEMRQLLLEHNRVRAEVGVAPLSWSEGLAAHARQWAEHLAAVGCRMEHRPAKGEWRGIYGENLFTGTAGHYGVVDAVRAWESEKRFFQREALTMSNVAKVGHYTQLVWRETRQVGCGKVQCQGRIILVCNYSPAGNILSERPY